MTETNKRLTKYLLKWINRLGGCWHRLVRKCFFFFPNQVRNKKTHYPPKVNGAQMANLHSDVATTGGWMAVTRFLTQFSAKREEYHTL